MINPWPKKTSVKEPSLITAQKENAIKTVMNKSKRNLKKSPWTTQLRSGQTKSKTEDSSNKTSSLLAGKQVAKTAYAANKQWLDHAEKVVKEASPRHKKIEASPTLQEKITSHFLSKVTPTSTSLVNKPTNPYATSNSI